MPHFHFSFFSALFRAIREMNDAFLGSRPMKVKRGEWQERDLRHVQKKQKKGKKLKKRYGAM